jgi:hypothetical protein
MDITRQRDYQEDDIGKPLKDIKNLEQQRSQTAIGKRNGSR